MNIKQIREEDCEKFDVKRACSIIATKNIPHKRGSNYLMVGSQSFLDVVVEIIGPLPQELDPGQRMVIEQSFTMAAQQFMGTYEHVMLIFKRNE